MKLPDNAQTVYQWDIFSVYEWEQQMFDGTTQIFERVSALPIIKLICVMADGQVLLNHEEQPGKDPFLSLPGGRLEPGETIEEGARRELLEETGYGADTLELLDIYSVGYRIGLDIHLYIARGLTHKWSIKFDAGERIKTQHILLEELIELSLSGRVHPRSFQHLLLREHYIDSTLKVFKQKILGNF